MNTELLLKLFTEQQQIQVELNQSLCIVLLDDNPYLQLPIFLEFGRICKTQLVRVAAIINSLTVSDQQTAEQYIEDYGSQYAEQKHYFKSVIYFIFKHLSNPIDFFMPELANELASFVSHGLHQPPAFTVSNSSQVYGASDTSPTFFSRPTPYATQENPANPSDASQYKHPRFKRKNHSRVPPDVTVKEEVDDIDFNSTINDSNSAHKAKNIIASGKYNKKKNPYSTQVSETISLLKRERAELRHKIDQLEMERTQLTDILQESTVIDPVRSKPQ